MEVLDGKTDGDKFNCKFRHEDKSVDSVTGTIHQNDIQMTIIDSHGESHQITAYRVARSEKNQNENATAAPGVRFVLDRFASYPAVAIGELPQCEQVHEFLRSLIQDSAFSATVNEIVVEFGNPLLQNVLDRYVVTGEDVPHTELRHVWDDTADSVSLVWDSPLYENFFAAVRGVNAALPSDKKIKVILAGVPIDWKKIRTKEDLAGFTGEKRAQAVADGVNVALNRGHRVLILGSSEELIRATDGVGGTPITILEKAHPGRVYVVAAQGRFGPGEAYRGVEAKQDSWTKGSIAEIKGTWLGSVPLNGSKSRRLEDAVDAVLYLGPSDLLTALRPRASIFRDDEYFAELNRRWEIVHGSPIRPTTQLFDLRAPYIPVGPRVSPQQASERNPEGVDGVEFILRTLDRYPVVGIGDAHMMLEEHAFLRRLIRDPRLPEKIRDIVVEFGNPLYQPSIDRYVLEGENVPRDERRGAWERAPMGCPVSCSPVYEQFYDVVREVNLKLPRDKRMRIILGDAPIDLFKEAAAEPAFLRKWQTEKETARDPREIALASSVNAVLAKGHRAIMICGNGHLVKGHRPGNARELIEKENPGKFFLIDPGGASRSAVPESVVSQGPDLASLALGPRESSTRLALSPLLYREADIWEALTSLMKLLHNKPPLSPGDPADEYRGRYFEKPWPSGLEAAPSEPVSTP
jgi:hypothetical protein